MENTEVLENELIESELQSSFLRIPVLLFVALSL